MPVRIWTRGRTFCCPAAVFALECIARGETWILDWTARVCCCEGVLLGRLSSLYLAGCMVWPRRCSAEPPPPLRVAAPHPTFAIDREISNDNESCIVIGETAVDCSFPRIEAPRYTWRESRSQPSRSGKTGVQTVSSPRAWRMITADQMPTGYVALALFAERLPEWRMATVHEDRNGFRNTRSPESYAKK